MRRPPRSTLFPCATLFRSVGDNLALRGLLDYMARYDSPDDRSEEHTSELQSRVDISYAVFCLKKIKRMQTGSTASASKVRSGSRCRVKCSGRTRHGGRWTSASRAG